MMWIYWKKKKAKEKSPVVYETGKEILSLSYKDSLKYYAVPDITS